MTAAVVRTSSTRGRSGAWRALSRAAAKLLLSLFAVSLVTFLATNAIPGGSAGRSLLGRGVTDEQIRTFEVQQGLDRPVLERYVVWVGHTVTGDFGESLAARQPVWDVIGRRLGRSTVLALCAFVLYLPLSVLIGLAVGRRAGSLGDRVSSVVTLLVTAVPEFLVGIAMLAVFAIALGLFPPDSTAVSLSSLTLGDAVRGYALPALTLALVSAPYLIRLTRANTREVIAEPFIRSAVLRGISARSTMRHHVLPNAAPPVINAAALTLVLTVSSIVSVENVFAFPGIGQLLVTSVATKDVPIVQALIVLIGATFVIVNALADVAVVLVTPKLRNAGRADGGR